MIIFWAIIGGLGASLLLPAMQSLIHGNFEGAAQKRAYALVGAAAAIAAAVGPLLGGFVTTYLSWRVGFLARGRDHRRRAVGHRAGQGRAVHRRPRASTSWAPCCRSSAWAASCSASSSGRRAASTSLALIAIGARRAGAARVVAGPAQARRASSTLLDPDLFGSADLPARRHRADAPADRAGRRDDRAADLPADGPRVQRDAGRPVARAAVADDVRRRAARRQAGRPTAGRRDHPRRASCSPRSAWPLLLPLVPRVDSGWWLVVPLVIAGVGPRACSSRSSTTTRWRRSPRSGSARPRA